MAQLNPNFEIDFSDINSYEQIQLINDTQLAKENLLMHRAYKEPSDDEIIRNHFSSFTFVDFCPKLFTSNSSSTVNNNQSDFLSHGSNTNEPDGSKSLRYYELETFSDLFDRINGWLKLNKDWRVVSMQTLVYDCNTQFNHLKSSIYSSYLPQNTRGLRLFLSPSKSRFSGPQKIGCINVVPRKLSGDYMKPDDPIVYETLDEILQRLNELLLTRPIEGRILSVETITLPMVNGYVNTETNYFMDTRLNLLNESTYNITNSTANSNTANNNNETTTNPATPSSADGQQEATTSYTSFEQRASLRGHNLIDILRVYYEFGPMVCGLVNLIDFVPKFYFTKPNATTSAGELASGAAPSSGRETPEQGATSDSTTPANLSSRCAQKIAPTESLTRLIRRSLAWFETERKRILAETKNGAHRRLIEEPVQSSSTDDDSSKSVNLRVCNLQVHQKTMLKRDLIQVNSSNALESINTRSMVHKRASLGLPIVCNQCSMSTSTDPVQSWCQHLHQLSQPYHIKFVRLAYVVPVYNRYAVSICSLRPLRSYNPHLKLHQKLVKGSHEAVTSSQSAPQISGVIAQQFEPDASTSDSSSESETSSSGNSGPLLITAKRQSGSSQHKSALSIDEDKSKLQTTDADLSSSMAESSVELDGRTVEDLLDGKEEELAKQAALDIVRGTNERHREDEQTNQLDQNDNGLNDSPIGQLTYRLFAPCQLVNSSSCFSINPVNSSSPLARRGSVDLNGSGISSENAQPSTLLLGGQSSSSETQQVVTSFGAFFPALSHDIVNGSSSSGGESNISSSVANKSNQQQSGGSRFTTNEFEPVEAIKRRMEIYVTTNSMKVIAGETLIVNLSDVLSCLSTAIEQTVAKAAFKQRRSTSWVSVYILYAAVEEPQLPNQLLAQQKLRELSLIDEGQEENDEQAKQQQQQQLTEIHNIDSLFDDDFKGSFDNAVATNIEGKEKSQKEETQASTGGSQLNSNQIRIEQNPSDSSITLYNSAYDRTVALPTQPDNHLNAFEHFEGLESLGDCMWLRENDLIEASLDQMANANVDFSRGQRKKKKKKKSRKPHEDSQCSIM